MKSGDTVKIDGEEVTLLRLVQDGDVHPQTRVTLQNPQRNQWWAMKPTGPGSSIKERVIVCTDGL